MWLPKIPTVAADRLLHPLLIRAKAHRRPVTPYIRKVQQSYFSHSLRRLLDTLLALLLLELAVKKYLAQCLLHLALTLAKVLALDQVGNLFVIVILLLPTFTLAALLQRLVALGELSERGERVGAKLVEDTRNELCQLLVLSVAVEREGVRGDGRVDCTADIPSAIART